MGKWLLLAYKIPREPSANRVYAWRKMKQLGAMLLQDAVWVLPESAKNREQFQWLAAEITELGGEAALWTSELLYATDELALRRQFEEQVDAVYSDIADKLKQRRPDMLALSKRFQQAQSQDFFQSKLGFQLREKLLSANARQIRAAKRQRKGRTP